MEKEKTNERRRYPRIATAAVLEISHPAFGVMKLKAKDASRGGFFAIRGVDALPPVGTEVDVIIKRHTGTINDQPTTMRVVHVNDTGMGLEFV